ncbi:MAG: hypothetical protein IKY44_03585 [Clostridia bacterium]|nr:hypothetical protein [Clostridia bacterium]
MAKTNLIDKIKAGFKGDKRLKIIVIAGVIGALLLLASEAFDTDTSSASQSVSLTLDTQEYAGMLEEELSEIISKIDGAGQCSVMVTVECGVETVYATQEQSSYDSDGNSQSHESELSYVVVGGSSGGKQALVIKEIQPRLRGIIIVCEGGGNSKVKMNIISAVSSAFDISSTKISVQKMK